MAILNKAARQARITAYKNPLMQKLASKIIDVDEVEFLDLVSDKGVPMRSLNGDIILERDLRGDGSLKGVVSISPDNLAAILPDLKNDTEDKMGWKKYLDEWQAEGVDDIFDGVADPTPDEYELSTGEELAMLDIGSMSDAEAKAKLMELQSKLAEEEKGT